MKETTKLERWLCGWAEMHSSDKIASRAMKVLRQRYDKTYGWCEDCDGVVCIKRDCCINRIEKEGVQDITFDDNG